MSPLMLTAGPASGSDGGQGGWIDDHLHDPVEVVQRLFAYVREWAPIAGPLLVVGIVVVVVGRGWWRHRCHQRLLPDARVVTVLAPPMVDPAGGVAVWSNLVGLLHPAWKRWLLGQPHLAFEYVFSDAGVAIRFWVPGRIPPGMVERAVEAAWPGAHTRSTPADPPLPVPDKGQQRRITIGGRLRLARPEVLPIRTSFEADPIRALIGAPVGLGRGEYACVQILARPVAGWRLRRARRAARRVHPPRATHPSDRRRSSRTALFNPVPGSRSRIPMRLSDDPQALTDVAENRAIRYAVATLLSKNARGKEVRQARATARGRAHALAAAFATYAEHNYYHRRRIPFPARILAHRRLRRGDLLSVPELAALAHLPLDGAIPGVQRAGARAIAPPPGVATPGPEAKPLGLTDTGHRRAVALRVPDGRHHLHVLGATGSGKSTLLGNLILDEADHGRGVVVIDPKGDLVTDVLSRLPADAGERLVLFDADSRTRPPCLNPLAGGETDLVVDNLVSVFRRVYSAFWGPRTDDVMRAACLTLRAQEGVATLADLPKLLAEPAFRARVTAGLTDPVLRGFWSWYEDLTDASRSQVISPLMNKLRAFLLRPWVRDTLAGGESTVDMSAVLNGGICLVRIPKGSLGEETTRLIGSLVMAQTWQALTGRARIPERQRQDASIVIDECQNFLNLPYPVEDMLAEARGLRGSFVLAHQHLGQLSRELREGISTNARNKLYFNAGPEDARDLARHTSPQLSDHDLSHLGAYHAAARLVLHGEEAHPFTLITTPLRAAVPGRSRALRRAASTHRTTTRPPGRTDHTTPGTAPATAASPTPAKPSITDPRRTT
jgi:hypothetical protein